MYVAVKGGEKAIDAAHRLLAEARRGDLAIPEITTDQIEQQMTLAVDRVMTEGSLYDRGFAALAIKQARGDLIEAIFLVRAARTTLARFGYATALETSEMQIRRRISAAFKDIPGGQILGPTFDYTHRLLEENTDPQIAPVANQPIASAMPKVLGLLASEGLIEEPLQNSLPPGNLGISIFFQ